jgi:hypothetical protein
MLWRLVEPAFASHGVCHSVRINTPRKLVRRKKIAGFRVKPDTTQIPAARGFTNMPAQGRKAGPMPRRLLVIIVLSALALSVAAVPAFAASTSQEGYTTPAGVVQSDVAGTNGNNDANTTRSTSGSQLHFTGLDVGLIAGAGALLVLLGVGMSRLTRARARIH